MRCGCGLIEAHAHKTLCRQVVDFLGPGFLHQRDAGAQIRQVIFHQVQLRVVLYAQFFDPPKIDGACATIRAIDRVTFFQQELGKVRTILTRDARHQSSNLHIFRLSDRMN